MHLLYSEKDLALNEMIISDSAPSRENLGKMYQPLKAIAKQRGYIIQAATDDLEEGLANLVEGFGKRQWQQAHHHI